MDTAPIGPDIESEQTPAGVVSGTGGSGDGRDSSDSVQPSLYLPNNGGVRAVAFGVVILAILGGITYGVLSARPDSQPMNAWLVQNDGRQFLKVRCDDCPDDSVVSWNGGAARVNGGFAVLGAEGARLPVGEAPVDVVVTRPNEMPVQRSMTTQVPFRFATDLKPLSEHPPRVAVEVEAMPKAVVSVNGSDVRFDRFRHARVLVPLDAEVVGPAATTESYRRDIPYVVRLGSDVSRGTLPVEVDITPLALAEPGDRISTNKRHFTVVGQSAPGANVEIDGAAIPVDAEGGFAHRIELGATGETPIAVRAVRAGALPRTIPIMLVRTR
jgi:hypothetical protein